MAKRPTHTTPARHPAKQKHPAKHKTPVSAPPSSQDAGDPVFAEPAPSPDPGSFRAPVTDQRLPQTRNVDPFPKPRGNTAEPVMQLADALGSHGASQVAAIQQAGQIVFHALGDSGSVKGPSTQSLVADKLVADFTEAVPADVPSFLYHLGDVVYNFGEAARLEFQPAEDGAATKTPDDAFTLDLKTRTIP